MLLIVCRILNFWKIERKDKRMNWRNQKRAKARGVTMGARKTRGISGEIGTRVTRIRIRTRVI